MGRKGKAVAASSKKALELCGDTSKLGVSAADIFAQFASPGTSWTPAEEAYSTPVASAALEDKEVSMALHALQKKDPTTRLRGVGELQQLFSSRSQADLREVAMPFLNLYRRLWPQDSEPRVREGIQRCLQTLVETLHREFASHLRSAFPTWLCAMFDTHTEVTQAARRAFAASFQSDEKKRGVFRHCRTECLALLSANLRHSEQSLHEELGLTSGAAGDKNVALERQDRYARVVAASLSGLGELINICAVSSASSPAAGAVGGGAGVPAAEKPAGTLSDEDLAPFFTVGSPCALWLRLAPKQPALARRAAAECLARVFQSPAGRNSSICRSTQVRSGILCTLGDEAVPPAIATVLLCRFAEAGGKDCWDGINVTKALWPQLIALAKRGAPREGGFLERLAELLRALPDEVWAAGRGEALLRILLEALQAPRSPKAELWRGYMAVIKAADQGKAPVLPLWRWAPIQLYLQGQADFSDTATKDKEPSDAASAETLPISALSSAACAGLQGALTSELPALMRQAEDAQDMLETFARCAPPVDPSLLMQGSVCKAWSSWIGLLAKLLTLPVLSEEMRERASGLIAEKFRSLITSAMGLPVLDSAAAIPKVLDALESFLVAEVAPARSWAPAKTAESLQTWKMSDELLRDPNEAASVEESLLAWPILPWWKAWAVSDPSGEAAFALGVRVVRPFLSAALRRLGERFPVQKVRESIAQAMLQMPAALAPASREGDGASPEVSPSILSSTVKLYMECLPAEMAAASSPVLEAAVDHLTCFVVQGERSSDAAWKLALQPGDGALSADRVCKCIDALMQAVEDQNAKGSSREAFRFARLGGEVLASHARCSGGLPLCLQRFWDPVCRLLLGELVSGGSGDTDPAEQRLAWDLLPGLLAGAESETVCQMLGDAPATTAARERWVCAMRIAGTSTGAHPVSLLCMCRGGQQTLQLDGPVFLPELYRNSLATAGVMVSSQNFNGAASLVPSAEGGLATAAFLLFWEVLLADAVLPELAVYTAIVRAWLVAAEASLQEQFLKFCTEAAANEGQKWWLCLASNPSKSSDDACQYSLSVLNKVVATLWEHLHIASQSIKGSSRLAEVWNGIPNCQTAGPNWGRTMSMVLEQHAYLEEILAQYDKRRASHGLDDRRREHLRSLEQELNNPASEQATADMSASVSATNAGEALTARTKMRQAVDMAIASQQVCAPLLHVATTVELWTARTPGVDPLDEDRALTEELEDSEQAPSEEQELKAKSIRELKQILDDRGITPALPPVEKQDYITAIVTAGPQKPAPTNEDQIRSRQAARLIERHERLLRWAQSSKSLDQKDAFASYTASLWPALSAATPEMSSSSKVVTRMHRFGLEILSDSKESIRCKAPPGGLKLVAALAEAKVWPDSSWTSVLQAIVETDTVFRSDGCRESHKKGDGDAAASRHGDLGEMTSLPIAKVFIDEVLAAAANLLLHMPVSLLPKVVPLLAARHPSLQAAAACRLRLQNWVCESNPATPETSSKVLQLQFEGVLMKGEVDADTPTADDAACRDVIFAVLLAAVGSELSAEAWGVDRALTDFLEWEAEVQHAEVHADASDSDQASDGDTQEKPGRITDAAATAVSRELPTHCRQRCIATLSAWELVLLGLQQSQAPESDRSSSDESEPMSLPEIVATALQITPEEIVGTRARKGWPSTTAPTLEASSPLPLLLRLVCHILNCKHIADEAAASDAGIEDLLQRVAVDGLPSAERHGFDIYTLAARVFYLLLRAMPAAARGFWERLPRRRDRDLVERLVANSFSSILAQAEVQGASALLKARAEKFPDVEALVVRRKEQIVLQLERDELRAEVCVQMPEAFPLRMATAEQPEKMPGIPPKRIRNWMLQSRQVLSGPSPPCIGHAMLMWARSFALFFDGVEDCPICYNVVHLSTQTIPRKACPTCKHKFHNECLYHWFKTSAKTTCPLCNQPF